MTVLINFKNGIQVKREQVRCHTVYPHPDGTGRAQLVLHFDYTRPQENIDLEAIANIFTI